MRHWLSALLLIGCAVVRVSSTSLKFVPHEQLNNPSKVFDVICPDQQSQCPDGQTCCEIGTGQWACCPMPQAVCCSDKLHCCPHAYTCDVAHSTCLKDPLGDGPDTLPWVHHIDAVKVHTPDVVQKDLVSDVICPDQQSQCPDGQTCCQIATGEWGCCPMPQAVCCSDMLHCCPHAYTCDVTHSTCLKGPLGDGPDTLPWVAKVDARKISVFDEIEVINDKKVSDVICPDQQSQCPDGQTCCETGTGQWACCPMPQAVCCSDKLHCCPHAYTCDVAHSRCLQGPLGDGPDTLPWVHHVDATKVEGRREIKVQRNAGSNDVRCDDTSACPDGQTCCKMPTGDYGCCPLPKANCCSDMVHCCPNGYSCDLSAGTCDQDGLPSIPFSAKLPANRIGSPPAETAGTVMEVEGRACSGDAWCKEGKTCCESSSGARGCCTMKDAVCCSDGVHCCPAGTVCASAKGQCRSVDSSLAFSWLATRRIDGYGALRPLGAPEAIQCTNESSCPDRTTCCLRVNKQFSCCPYADGVCCADQLHCCPHGMTCDDAHSRCNQADGAVQVQWTFIARTRAKPSVAVTGVRGVGDKETCPDLKSQCPDLSTCCEMQSGAYGCCPYANAVCCSDRLHCCPGGSTCDLATGSCSSSTNKLRGDGKQGSGDNVVPFPFLDPGRL